MAGEVLLDSSIVVRFLRSDHAVVSRFPAGARVRMSSIVIGEVLYGALLASRSREETQKVAQFAARCEILPVDAATGQQYAQVKHALRLKGRPIPDNDIWIAAQALQHGLTLVSRDRHFRDVDGLRIEEW
jgi:tRNA(fMet)-specific endonuclease VapC